MPERELPKIPGKSSHTISYTHINIWQKYKIYKQLYLYTEIVFTLACFDNTLFSTNSEYIEISINVI